MTATVQVTNQPQAHAALQAAHEGGYRFPADFAGFSAEVQVEHDGETQNGRVTLRSPREIEIDLEADEETLGWLRQELGSMAGHRWPTPYAESDGRWTLTLEARAGDPLGDLIRVHDDPFNSSYRVRDGRITQVNRQMGPTRFSINIHEHTETADGRTLPAVFTVAFWDSAQGRLSRTDEYLDRYVEVAGVQLPAERRILRVEDDGISVRKLTLSGHTLL
ncbi:MAG: DUF3386 family protein [Thermomicrobiales bacterium]